MDTSNDKVLVVSSVTDMRQPIYKYIQSKAIEASVLFSIVFS